MKPYEDRIQLFSKPIHAKGGEMANPVPTKPFYSQAQKQPCYLSLEPKPAHLLLTHPFCWHRTQFLRMWTLPDVTSQVDSWMMHIAIKQLINWFYLKSSWLPALEQFNIEGQAAWLVVIVLLLFDVWVVWQMIPLAIRLVYLLQIYVCYHARLWVSLCSRLHVCFSFYWRMGKSVTHHW